MLEGLLKLRQVQENKLTIELNDSRGDKNDYYMKETYQVLSLKMPSRCSCDCSHGVVLDAWLST